VVTWTSGFMAAHRCNTMSSLLSIRAQRNRRTQRDKQDEKVNEEEKTWLQLSFTYQALGVG
jgi:hypothetical protein